MLQRIEYPNREEWEKGRIKRIGASEVAAVLGLSPFMSNVDLWKLKTGRTAAKDISGNAFVEFGTKAEAYLRGLYTLDYPQYRMEHHPFDVLYQDDFPCLGVTLDGELTEIATGRQGIWEAKTAEVTKKTQWAEWQGKVKQAYFIQVLSQLLATGWDFANLYAKLRGLSGDSQLRHYEFERTDYESDIEYVRDKVDRFWYSVEKDKQPALIMPTLEGWED